MSGVTDVGDLRVRFPLPREGNSLYSGSVAIDVRSVASCDSMLALCALSRRSMSPVVSWRVWTRAASRAPTRAPISDRRFTISSKIGFMPKTISDDENGWGWPPFAPFETVSAVGVFLSITRCGRAPRQSEIRGARSEALGTAAGHSAA